MAEDDKEFLKNLKERARRGLGIIKTSGKGAVDYVQEQKDRAAQRKVNKDEAEARVRAEKNRAKELKIRKKELKLQQKAIRGGMGLGGKGASTLAFNWLIIAIIIHAWDVFWSWRTRTSYGWPNRDVVMISIYVIYGVAFFLSTYNPENGLKKIVVSFVLGIVTGFAAGLFPVFMGMITKNIPPSAMFLEGWLLYLGCFWLWWFVVKHYGDQRVAKFAIWYCLIVLIPAAFAVTAYGTNMVEDYLPEGTDRSDPMASTSAFFEWSGDQFKGFIRNLLKAPIVTWDNVVNRTLGPQFFGTVERNKNNEQLGVYLDITDPAHYEYLQGEDISVFATVRGRTFTGEVDVKNECYLRFPRSDLLERYLYIQGDMNPEEAVKIVEHGFYDLVCIVPYERIESAGINYTKSHNPMILFRSTFDFETWGYVTYAFMDYQELAKWRERPHEAARQLGLDPYVQAVYTDGPISLGLVDPSQRREQPIPINRNSTSNILPIKFGVTIKNRYGYSTEGKIVELKRLTFKIPNIFVMEREGCVPYQYVRSGPDSDPEFANRNYDEYVFENIEMRERDQYITIRCTVKARDDVNAVLGIGGVSINTFAVKAEYNYKLEEQRSVRLEKVTVLT